MCIFSDASWPSYSPRFKEKFLSTLPNPLGRDTKTLRNSSYARPDVTPTKLFKTGMILTINVALLSSYKFLSVLKQCFQL